MKAKERDEESSSGPRMTAPMLPTQILKRHRHQTRTKQGPCAAMACRASHLQR